MIESSEKLAEYAGELFLLAFAGRDPEPAISMIRDYGLSGLYLSNENIPSREAAIKFTTTVQEASKKSGQSLPLLLGVDQEGTWSVMAEDSSPGPGNLALGSSNDPELTGKRYHHLAEELSACGLNLVFAPCSDVNTNPSNAIIGMRSFGTKAEHVGLHVAAAVRGVQAGGIFPTLKHFPGHGDTYVDSHRDLPTVSRSEKEVRSIDLVPFSEGIKAGVELVMTSHICFESLDSQKPATFSSLILQKILREEMGFQGVIISDSMNMHALQKHYDPIDASVEALRAGVDLIMLAEEHYDHDKEYQNRQRNLVEGVKEAIRHGKIAKERIQEALSRVRRLREKISSQPNRELKSKQWNSSSYESAEKALRILQKHPHWQRPILKSKIKVIRASTSKSYELVTKTRGIGPNPKKSSFEALIGFLKDFYEVIPVQNLEELSSPEDHIIMVLENYTLPGVDFDHSRDDDLIQQLLEGEHMHNPEKVTLIALRDAFQLPLDHPFTTLCTFSFREESANSVVEWLVDEKMKILSGDPFS